MSKTPERLRESRESQPEKLMVEIGGVAIPSGTELTIDIEHEKGKPRSVERGYTLIIGLRERQGYYLVVKDLAPGTADLRYVSGENIVRNNTHLFEKSESRNQSSERAKDERRQI